MHRMSRARAVNGDQLLLDEDGVLKRHFGRADKPTSMSLIVWILVAARMACCTRLNARLARKHLGSRRV